MYIFFFFSPNLKTVFDFQIGAFYINTRCMYISLYIIKYFFLLPYLNKTTVYYCTDI